MIDLIWRDIEKSVSNRITLEALKSYHHSLKLYDSSDDDKINWIRAFHCRDLCTIGLYDTAILLYFPEALIKK